MKARISQQELESYLWGAATLLRGTIDAGDYKQFIFPLLFYKRICDVFDEETETALKESGGDKTFAAYRENHRFQVSSEAHWFEVRQTSNNVGQALQSAMRAIETANPEKLYGIFGDAQWTNKDRLSDAMLRDLVEHFSSLELTLANLPEDELGQGYEYLIKKFADDAGHTAAEFYTNRTVVHLMTEMLEPQPGESIYDPTCGSGGMLLSCITHLRRQNKEWRNVRLYGQERNLMTSSIARMNCFLHGIEDFQIVRGDTLSEPKFVQGDRLMRFDVVLANPPYSIKQWDREAFASDPWGRNLYGTPPQGRADYAFWQHILCSLAPKTGRCAILFPHGVLFRQEELEMRRKIIESDVIECVIGLGPNLFYNSPMEACVVICRTAKPRARKGRILFINAVNEVSRERAQSFLTGDNLERIVKAYENFKDEAGFTRLVTIGDVRKQDWSINIPLYVVNSEHRRTEIRSSRGSLDAVFAAWLCGAKKVRKSINALLGDDENDDPLSTASKLKVSMPVWFDRSKWQRLRFDEIATNIREPGQPTPEDAATYIGLEHMDSGSLQISRWGSEANLKGQKLKMRKGDILFAKRNAYLRRVAIAPHDGFFSAHGMILRAKSETMLEEFLPFLMMSDTYMNRAVEISVGSLSPTINWTMLQIQEFNIPPLDQQRRIADILRAADEVVEGWRKSKIQHIQSQHAYASAVTMAGLDKSKTQSSPIGAIPVGWQCLRIDEMTTSSAYGPRFPGSQYSPAGNVKTVRTTDFDRSGGIDFSEIPAAKLDNETVTAHQLRPGDFLLSRSGEYAGLTAVFSEPGDGNAYIPGAFLIRYRFDDRLDVNYLLALCCSGFGDKFVKLLATGSAQPNISGSAFGRLYVPVPPIAEQHRIVKAVSAMRCVGEELTTHAVKSSKLMSILLNNLS
jgi:type I restriction enzyme M protein